MARITWEEVLAREDLVGGDIEIQEADAVYRGPLTEIKEVGNSIHFTTSWCARLGLDSENVEWVNCDKVTSSVTKDMTVPHDIGDGRVFFEFPFVGVCTIFPKGGSKLNPAKVTGLVIAT